ncbi:hypothetical protein [Hydrocarboniphaga effusa]|uniref:hypothetical protein n=1 Tax=Hydrocarboniphaga effusa TaxID=243629 RepID=UPI0031379796
MEATEHSALITASARAALRPIGCTQKGRSRTWLDDHGWWVAVIEFQPSAWARGSYLNVGVCWLWSMKGFLSFDDGYRVEDFREFTGADDFAHAASQLAERAKEETLKLRSRFTSIEATATYLGSKEARDIDIWAHFHAGVSAGLAGWPDRARERLEAALGAAERDAEWVHALKRHCVSLLRAVDDTEAFRHQVRDNVARERQSLKLKPWPTGARVEF